jgi:hypothetical protein
MDPFIVENKPNSEKLPIPEVPPRNLGEVIDIMYEKLLEMNPKDSDVWNTLTVHRQRVKEAFENWHKLSNQAGTTYTIDEYLDFALKPNETPPTPTRPDLINHNQDPWFTTNSKVTYIELYSPYTDKNHPVTDGPIELSAPMKEFFDIITNKLKSGNKSEHPPYLTPTKFPNIPMFANEESGRILLVVPTTELPKFWNQPASPSISPQS